MRRVAIFLVVLPLAACVTVRQTPLPNNRSVADDYPSAAAGERQADLRLAANYRSGAGGVGRNDAEALRRWLNAAEAGSVEAQQALAGFYRMRDRERAAYWFLRIAESGNKLALSSLATLYATPTKDAPADYRAALKWAYAANSAYLIKFYEQRTSPDERAEARRLADEWQSRQPAREKQ